mmetsp:Transcript_77501/g.250866  ORF Transcript_77501/g.250866 Transcript_77501/m.250866 type:complete len:118 (-) Transcript_77501:84-437(-)
MNSPALGIYYILHWVRAAYFLAVSKRNVAIARVAVSCQSRQISGEAQRFSIPLDPDEAVKELGELMANKNHRGAQALSHGDPRFWLKPDVVRETLVTLEMGHFTSARRGEAICDVLL